MNYWIVPGLQHPPARIYKSVILKSVCDHYDVSYDSLTQKNKKSRIRILFDARIVAFMLLREIRSGSQKAFSMKKIGEMFRLHHSTVINGLRRADELYKYDADFRLAVDKVRAAMKSV